MWVLQSTLMPVFADTRPGVLREDVLAECSALIRVLAVWRAIIHAICSGGMAPNCKVA